MNESIKFLYDCDGCSIYLKGDMPSKEEFDYMEKKITITSFKGTNCTVYFAVESTLTIHDDMSCEFQIGPEIIEPALSNCVGFLSSTQEVLADFIIKVALGLQVGRQIPRTTTERCFRFWRNDEGDFWRDAEIKAHRDEIEAFFDKYVKVFPNVCPCTINGVLPE